MPLSADGMRIEPSVSVPSATSASPAATAAPDPPLEPPAVRSCPSALHGLTVRPKCGFSVVMPHANSCVFVLPVISAPAARSAATAGASRSGSRRKNDDPARVGKPATSMMSFTATVTPCSGPRSPIGTASSRAASRSTASRSMATYALMREFNASMRSSSARARSVTESGAAALMRSRTVPPSRARASRMRDRSPAARADAPAALRTRRHSSGSGRRGDAARTLRRTCTRTSRCARRARSAEGLCRSTRSSDATPACRSLHDPGRDPCRAGVERDRRVHAHLTGAPGRSRRRCRARPPRSCRTRLCSRCRAGGRASCHARSARRPRGTP